MDDIYLDSLFLFTPECSNTLMNDDATYDYLNFYVFSFCNPGWCVIYLVSALFNSLLTPSNFEMQKQMKIRVIILFSSALMVMSTAWKLIFKNVMRTMNDFCFYFHLIITYIILS